MKKIKITPEIILDEINKYMPEAEALVSPDFPFGLDAFTEKDGTYYRTLVCPKCGLSFEEKTLGRYDYRSEKRCPHCDYKTSQSCNSITDNEQSIISDDIVIMAEKDENIYVGLFDIITSYKVSAGKAEITNKKIVFSVITTMNMDSYKKNSFTPFEGGFKPSRSSFDTLYRRRRRTPTIINKLDKYGSYVEKYGHDINWYGTLGKLDALTSITTTKAAAVTMPAAIFDPFPVPSDVEYFGILTRTVETDFLNHLETNECECLACK